MVVKHTTFLNNQWVKEESTKEIRKFFDVNEDGGEKKKPNYVEVKILTRGFHSGPVVKNLCSQCRGPGFDPWSGN